MEPQAIKDQPLPLLDGTLSSTTTAPSTSGVSLDSENGVIPPVIQEKPLPAPVIATDTISTALDTQARLIKGSFTFSQLGAIKIGNYVSGTSGEIDITPNGITAKDSTGATTFTLDGTTGNATFKGTIQAGALISGAVDVGSASVIIDGANGRIIINDGTTNRIAIGNV